MSEVAFTRQFLTALNTRPLKLNPDYAEDPKTHLQRLPCTLAKPPPITKRPRLKSPPSTTITLKTLRPPHLSFTTPYPLPLAATTILTLKFLLSQHTSIPIDKLKILNKGKVLADVTFLSEIYGDVPPAAGVGTLHVMLMGGAVPKEGTAGVLAGVGFGSAGAGGGVKVEVDMLLETEAEGGGTERGGEGHVITQEESKSVLDGEPFWSDLHHWIVGKLVDAGETQQDPQERAEELTKLFRNTWNSKC